MSDKDVIMGIDLESIKEFQEVKARKEAGEVLDPRTEEALASIQMAGNVIDSIMEGKLVDLAYFKIFSARMTGKMEELNKEMAPPKKVPKNSRKYRKMMRKKKAKDKKNIKT